MDINHIPSARDLARLTYEETRREVAQDNRDRVRGAREELARLSEVRAQRMRAVREAFDDAHVEAARRVQSSRGDQVEISDRGRILAGDHGEEPAAVDRAARLAELADRFERGQVNTPEAIERAATRLLGGE